MDIAWIRKLLLCAFLLGYCPPVFADDTLPGIVFVSDVIFGDKYIWPGVARPSQAHWREGYIYHRATTQHPIERTTTPTRPGSNLYTLVPARPNGTLTRITHLTDGEVFDPETSYDGRTILFSMRRDGEDWFNLYEIGADGNVLSETHVPPPAWDGLAIAQGCLFLTTQDGILLCLGE